MRNQEAELEEAIRSASTTADIKKLIRHWQGDRQALMSSIGLHASVFDDELVMLLLVSGASLHGLAQNPHLPSKYNDQIVEWLVNRVIGESYQADVVNARTALKKFLRNKPVSANNPALQFLITSLAEASDTPLNRIWDLVAILVAVPAFPGLSPAFFERIYERWGRHLPDETLCDFVLHPQTPLHVIKEILDEKRNSLSYEQIQAIVQVDRIRHDPELRSQLTSCILTNGAYECLLPLLLDRDKDCAELFRMLPLLFAAYVLRIHGDKIAPLLSSQDLLPLIRSDNRDIRLVGIAYLSKTQRTDTSLTLIEQAEQTTVPKY